MLDNKIKNIAMLIDADNAPAKFIQKILTELANYGKVNIRKAYGNWASTNLNGWRSIIQDYAIQPIQQFDLTKGKNATDIALTIDAIDILYTKDVDVFCIVSSDCDFTPLVTRILSDGKFVIGFGQRKTPTAFVNACSTFLFLDDEIHNKSKDLKESELENNTQLIKLLKNSIVTTKEDNGWSFLSKVGKLISNHTSFDPRNYGFSKLKDLIGAVEIFDIKRDEKNNFIVKIK